jgi:hypothetical protein
MVYWKDLPGGPPGSEENSKKIREYMKSPEMGIKKEAIKKRSNGVCERCHKKQGCKCIHKTFQRVFNEKLEDLLWVCGDCSLDIYYHNRINNRNSNDIDVEKEKQDFVNSFNNNAKNTVLLFDDFVKEICKHFISVFSLNELRIIFNKEVSGLSAKYSKLLHCGLLEYVSKKTYKITDELRKLNNCNKINELNNIFSEHQSSHNLNKELLTNIKLTKFFSDNSIDINILKQRATQYIENGGAFNKPRRTYNLQTQSIIMQPEIKQEKIEQSGFNNDFVICQLITEEIKTNPNYIKEIPSNLRKKYLAYMAKNID